MFQITERQYTDLVERANRVPVYVALVTGDAVAVERELICQWILNHRNIWYTNAVECIRRGDHRKETNAPIQP